MPTLYTIPQQMRSLGLPAVKAFPKVTHLARLAVKSIPDWLCSNQRVWSPFLALYCWDAVDLDLAIHTVSPRPWPSREQRELSTIEVLHWSLPGLHPPHLGGHGEEDAGRPFHPPCTHKYKCSPGLPIPSKQGSFKPSPEPKFWTDRKAPMPCSIPPTSAGHRSAL